VTLERRANSARRHRWQPCDALRPLRVTWREVGLSSCAARRSPDRSARTHPDTGAKTTGSAVPFTTDVAPNTQLRASAVATRPSTASATRGGLASASEGAHLDRSSSASTSRQSAEMAVPCTQNDDVAGHELDGGPRSHLGHRRARHGQSRGPSPAALCCSSAACPGETQWRAFKTTNAEGCRSQFEVGGIARACSAGR